ncbi:substrate-binding domain-containing protein [Aeromonas media]|jgi:ribose transport system substrate-binding protein|uniref:substrate-binding domain-containing protein n=1 Tax=Aeromonas TaxID=642 RepID=UPI000FB0F7EC|nr:MULTISPECIES: substrate-binding domain-containing protein [Aeromonas]MBP8151961.1 substrate-binding domain-containing protein [Aeromonas sp.]MBL0513362.1 substrate-binding domain-containing protein [Aeromonas media]MBV7469454.1 substrate-binding domain-containing protein [Aeromonas sp. sif0611]MCY9823862.1 substrate-binding domain-containing protein [Aeromonas media]MCY9835477.1 substrate-binding domain-containing protein [Aeromonas media]
MLAKRSHFLLAALTAAMLLGNGAQAAEATTTLGPNGEQPTPYTQVTLTTAQQDRVKAQHYTAAILMHTTSDWSSALIKGAKDRFHDLNVKVVAVTDAEFNANKQRTDVETVMAMAPDIILTLVVDPVSGAAAFRPAVQQGSKLVLISNLPTGFEYGKDYAGIVTDDLFEMGGLAADMLAKTVGEQGKIGFIYHEANYYVTNQRDQAVLTNLAKHHPGVQILAKQGIANANDGEVVASALITQHPDIQAIYAPWDSIAEGVVAATRAAGRSDIKVITMDLGAANALDMAKGRNVAGIVTDLPYDLGQTLATMGALAKLGEQTPPFVTVSADAVTRDNLADAWQQALRRDPPAAVTKALSQ